MRLLPVMEIYPAAQGEGSRLGAPSIFVRLFGCNLRCTWCDTSYSINMKEARAVLSPEEVADLYYRYTLTDLLQNLKSFGRRDVVITGGEPTLYSREIGGLARSAPDFFFTVETNGTRVPEINDFRSIQLWSLSPKLSGSQANETLEEKRKVDLWEWFSLTGADSSRIQLKFVITRVKEDLDEVSRLLVNYITYLRVLQIPIFLTPNGDYFMNGDPEVGRSVTNRILEEVSTRREWRDLNIRVFPQVHLLLAGRKRFT